MTAPSNKNPPFRWNQDPIQAGRELPYIPFSCAEITGLVLKAIETSPCKEILGFEGQLTTYPCIEQFQERVASKGYKTVVCLNPNDAAQKMGTRYGNPKLWCPGQHQIFIIKGSKRPQD